MRNIRMLRTNLFTPETRDVVHVDKVEHTPSVPELGAVVEV